MANQQQQNKTQGKDSNVRTGMQGSQELEAQNRYWRENFRNEPYYSQGKDFDAYEPAYRLGSGARDEYPGKSFVDIEDDLKTQYQANQQAQQRLDWSEARQAVRAAWDRSDQSAAGANKSKSEQQRSRH